MKLEIERKFLLKRLPKNIQWTYPMDRMDQCYTARGRYRMVQGDTMRFIKTKKKELRPGVYEETEKNTTGVEFMKAFARRKKMLRKCRYYKKDENGLVWEIDVYVDINLVIAEVELPKEGYKLKIPKFIKNDLIMEVTKFKQFKNSELAE